MSSWACSNCTFLNPPSQRSHCEICLYSQPQTLLSSPSSLPSKPKWSCSACTFLNPHANNICEICGTRASVSLLSNLETNDDDLQEAQLGSSVFSPLPSRGNSHKGDSGSPTMRTVETGSSGLVKDVALPLASGDNGNFGIRRCPNSEIRVVKTGNKAVEAKSVAAGVSRLGSGSDSKTWKILTYNIWFQPLEMHERMKALSYLIELNSPEVICFQEVTVDLYRIFKRSSWWKVYRCSIPDERAIEAAYFCMQLCKLPVKSYSSRSFHNSCMGRELCIAEVEFPPAMALVVATSHLESPCPAPPTWDQMFSKERVLQAKEAIRFLEKNRNVIFCGDMNWDDKLDGPFPLLDGWVDAWTELRPGEVGWTYDTKSNKMLSANRTLQKRLDRFVCKLKDIKIAGIQMIGRDEIPGLTYINEKRVKGQVKELTLPVFPSDHFGLLLTISPNETT